MCMGVYLQTVSSDIKPDLNVYFVPIKFVFAISGPLQDCKKGGNSFRNCKERIVGQSQDCACA